MIPWDNDTMYAYRSSLQPIRLNHFFRVKKSFYNQKKIWNKRTNEIGHLAFARKSVCPCPCECAWRVCVCVCVCEREREKFLFECIETCWELWWVFPPSVQFCFFSFHIQENLVFLSFYIKITAQRLRFYPAAMGLIPIIPDIISGESRFILRKQTQRTFPSKFLLSHFWHCQHKDKRAHTFTNAKSIRSSFV